MIKTQSYNWDDVLHRIPGYDPYRDSDGYWFDEKTAGVAIDFFPRYLTHVKGAMAGRPFQLEPWEMSIVANLFGWKSERSGFRRYREGFIFVPRKNGKTSLIAGIANLVLFADSEPGAEIYCAAADRDQASLLFEQAAGMVHNNGVLSSVGKVYRRSIAVESSGSSFKVISADAKTKHGFNVHLSIVDELHAQANSELVDVLETSTGARDQPLCLSISTSDFEREGSICNQKHEYASRVRDGIIKNPAFLPVIYEASRDDDWTAPAVWAKANPNLGVSLGVDYINAMCKKAQDSPAFENTFKRLHLNIRTEQDVRWLSMDKWDLCGAVAVEDESLKGRVCYAGLDLSTNTDLSALCLLFPPDDKSRAFRLLMWFWIPAERAYDREKRDRVPYMQWANEGFIETTEGNVIDHDVIRARINELSDIYAIKEVAIDRYNATQIITQLAGDGFTVVPFGQGFVSMSSPTKEFEKLILSGRLGHGNNPVLRWMASNVSVEFDAAENIKPSKRKSTERIDGIVAAVMALGRAIAQEQAKRSVYETRGIVRL